MCIEQCECGVKLLEFLVLKVLRGQCQNLDPEPREINLSMARNASPSLPSSGDDSCAIPKVISTNPFAIAVEPQNHYEFWIQYLGPMRM